MTRRPPSSSHWHVPRVTVKAIGPVHPPSTSGFLQLVRRTLVATSADGQPSARFDYDEVARAAMDAVVICAYYYQDGIPHVYLRSCLRPPVAFRRCKASDLLGSGTLWELPAGLIEADEVGPRGVLAAAARETREELGFDALDDQFISLGEAILPCPALIAEQQFFVQIEVAPHRRLQPTLDGSPLEQFGRVVAVPLAEALEQCAGGIIADGKSELGLRRLRDSLGKVDR